MRPLHKSLWIQKTILFDFGGVLCHDRFYEKTLVPRYQSVFDWLQTNVFSNKELVHDWMRNKVGSADINRLIAQNSGIEFAALARLFEESVRLMDLDQRVLGLARQLKDSGHKIGIVTDNMDVFSKITVHHHRLDGLFDVITNSADYGRLKKDENGSLFDLTLDTLGESIENSLMIDDSTATIDLFIQKGGQGHCFQDFGKLKSDLEKHTPQKSAENFY